MKSFPLNFWETLHGRDWFVPALMTAGAFALSFTLLSPDQRLHFQSLTGFAWIYAGSAAGARSVLSTVASLVITVAGTTNQIVLGTFIGTVVYCLLVLRTIWAWKMTFSCRI